MLKSFWDNNQKDRRRNTEAQMLILPLHDLNTNFMYNDTVPITWECKICIYRIGGKSVPYGQALHWDFEVVWENPLSLEQIYSIFKWCDFRIFQDLLSWIVDMVLEQFGQYCANRAGAGVSPSSASFLYSPAWFKERRCQRAFAAIPYQLPVQALKVFWSSLVGQPKQLFELVLRNARPVYIYILYTIYYILYICSCSAISWRQQGHWDMLCGTSFLLLKAAGL